MPRRARRGPTPRTRALDAAIIGGIWAGALPPQVQTPANAPPNTANLAQYGGRRLIKYMEDFPAHAVQIFNWGADPTNSVNTSFAYWPNHRQFATPADVVNWHQTRWPGTLNPTTAAGRRQIIANANSVGQWPIDVLIERDAVHALEALHTAGLWNPLWYNATGQSFLEAAATSTLAAIQNAAQAPAGAAPRRPRTWLVFNYILHFARTDRAFAVADIETTQLAVRVPGAPMPPIQNILDRVIQTAPYTAFIRYWDALDKKSPANGRAHFALNIVPAILTPASIEALCKTLPRGRAEKLAANNGLDLTTVPKAWYLARENPNSSFINFLKDDNTARARIDNIVPGVSAAGAAALDGTPLSHAAPGHTVRPLPLLAGPPAPAPPASTATHFRAFKNLVLAGADVNTWVELHFTPRTWPTDVRDRFWLEALRHYSDVNPGNGNTGLIHRVVNALVSFFGAGWFTGLTPTQRAMVRRRYVRDAVFIITFVLRGCRMHGRARLDATDEDGDTAFDTAKANGLVELEGLLSPDGRL
ncbi:hypothetical protein BDW74DRAFT_182793 [Aspergillus multicolor]|uniref:uncharacterized protein n=1 Tax=Aspergillus multicolor TaxID=41759 RepID=UPI003CCDA316